MLYKKEDIIEFELNGKVMRGVIIHVEDDFVIDGKKASYNYHVLSTDGKDFFIKESDVRSKRK